MILLYTIVRTPSSLLKYVVTSSTLMTTDACHVMAEWWLVRAKLKYSQASSYRTRIHSSISVVPEQILFYTDPRIYRFPVCFSATLSTKNLTYAVLLSAEVVATWIKSQQMQSQNMPWPISVSPHQMLIISRHYNKSLLCDRVGFETNIWFKS
jgi:hypothetical protein